MWKILSIAVIGAALVFTAGCGSDEGEVNTPADFADEAREQIDKTNYEAEVDRIEKELASEEAQETQ